MTTNLQVGDRFPDFVLPNHQNDQTQLSRFTQPGLMDQTLGFLDGYPLILVFYRGFFCPRDRQQFRQLVQFQEELAVNYGKLAVVSADPPLVQAAFRAGLEAQWQFLADEQRTIIKQINILDETEGEYAYRAQPYTFVLRPNLTIHKIYNGWFFVGRPTIEELRHDLRTLMETRSDYRYESYNTPDVKQIRIPQQDWLDGAPPLGTNGLTVGQGIIRWFDLQSGNGMIVRDDTNDEIFFNFTAIPGEGYRTLQAGTFVKFELVENKAGLTARNIQKQ
ncbi:MAG: cold-shock protein [Leptolyngbya sp.]|uniref:cold shock domain-containing protein n=1 Tax=Leptolyngbya sp. Cla-17 TaxID=2803751 RepID=UPI000DAF5CEF|nr:cold shock domain-containing protein [Leptolyngbya sp. Cla-17]MBM0745318.1 cold shock domain-containing protein [Leptolyngbya sp. Cla-17]PZV07543.1 MAG: cold-shock protein [Leptolyngbya sp.]